MDLGTPKAGVFGMQLTCSNCQTNYRIADEKIPAKGARAKCPNCGQIILVPGIGNKGKSTSFLPGASGTDFSQTMAYDFSEMDQSQTEISALLERVSDSVPFIEEGLVLFLRDIQTGEEYILPGAEVTLGRSGSDINVDDPEVSRRHCLIKVFGDQVVLMDLESTNGTYFRGRKVMTANLGVLEKFTIGNTVLELVKKQVD
jgi:predicted Zn finger-like uncharacterized protein